MAIAAVINHVQISAPNVPTTTATLPSNVTAGNLLVVAGGIWNTSANASMAVTKSSGTATIGSMTTLLSPTGMSYGGGVGQSYISYGFVTGSGSLVLLLDPAQAAGNYITGGTIEFSGVHATPLDVDGGEATILAPTTTPTDTITTATANDLIIGVLIGHGVGGQTYAVGSGYTQISEDEDFNVQQFSAEYRIVTTATTYNVDWTAGDGSFDFHVYDAAFKEATAPAVELIGTFMMA